MDNYRDIAPYYDDEHASFQDDVEFYLNILTDGPILEVGCGTARVMEPLALAGYTVWGIDSSEAMLAIARTRLQAVENVHLRRGSLLDWEEPVEFGGILFTLNALWHFGDLDEQVRALSIARRHLTPDGIVVVDLSSPLTMADRGGRGEVRERFRATRPGGIVIGTSATWDDEGEQVLHLGLTYDESRDGAVRRSTAELELRYVYRYELECAIRLAGLQLRGLYGSYDLDLYDGTSPNLLAVAGLPHL